MLNLNTTDNTRFDIPEASIIAIEETRDNNTMVAYNLGSGHENQLVTEKFGFLKKKLGELAAMPDPVELNLTFMDLPEDSDETDSKSKAKKASRRLLVSRNSIVSRVELKDQEDGTHCIVRINFGSGIATVRVAETIQFVAGEE